MVLSDNPVFQYAVQGLLTDEYLFLLKSSVNITNGKAFSIQN